jgi:hypothetical protein
MARSSTDAAPGGKVYGRLPAAIAKSPRAFRADCEPDESVRRLKVFGLCGLLRETGIHFRCNPH